MDICHLKTGELEPKYQRVQKGRVVLRDDIGEDDPGACAAFTEQGSSASQTTRAKAMDVVVTLLDCAGHAADAASAHTQDGGRSKNCSKFHSQTVQMCGYVFHDTTCENLGPTLKTQCFLFNEISTDTPLLASRGRDSSKKFHWDLECLFVHGN